MRDHSDYLEPRDIEIINAWVKKVKIYQIPSKKPDGLGPTELNLPYPIQGIGYKRIVYDIGNGNVLKVATSVCGILSGQNEAKIYKKARRSIRRFLGQIKESGDGWIIMKKYIQDVSDNIVNRNRVLQIEKKLLQKGIKPNDLFKRNKLKSWNIRLDNNGQIVIIDYGDFEKFDRNDGFYPS